MKRLRTVNRRGRQAEQRAASSGAAENESGAAEQGLDGIRGGREQAERKSR